MNWTELSEIIKSKNNIIILDKLLNVESTPTELAHSTKLHKSIITKSLKILIKNKAVSCLTPSQRKGKIFQITEKGKKIINKIREIKNGTV